MLTVLDACPPVGPTEDRRVAVLLTNSLQLGGQQTDGVVPLDLDEILVASPIIRPRAVLEPVTTNRRTPDPALVVDTIQHVLDQPIR